MLLDLIVTLFWLMFPKMQCNTFFHNHNNFKLPQIQFVERNFWIFKYSYTTKIQSRQSAPSHAAFRFSFESSSKNLYSIQSKLPPVSHHHSDPNLQPTSRVSPLLNCMWNSIQYYQLFLPVVQENLAKQKLAIQKELTGYVKIARWNDINFFAMKQGRTMSYLRE